MATNVTSTTLSVVDLASQLTKRFDTDKDGKLSTTEFTQLLSQLLGTLGNSTASTMASSSFATAGSLPAADRKPIGTMAGFDPGKLANLGHKTLKYEIGRILQYYPNTPEGLRAALPEIQQIVPEVKIMAGKGDKLDFGEYRFEGERIGIVDVIFAAGEGGKAWQWLTA